MRTVDGVQGLEFRTLIISTVRTCSVLSDNEEDAGFLSNPKVCHLYVAYLLLYVEYYFCFLRYSVYSNLTTCITSVLNGVLVVTREAVFQAMLSLYTCNVLTEEENCQMSQITGGTFKCPHVHP